MKYAVLSTVFVATFFIPNSFFVAFMQDVYADIARFISAAFLVCQIILIIDFAYAWNEAWLGNYEEAQGFWGFCLFFFSGLMWVAALILTVMNYYWFSTNSSCSVNITLITLTLVSSELQSLSELVKAYQHR